MVSLSVKRQNKVVNICNDEFAKYAVVKSVYPAKDASSTRVCSFPSSAYTTHPFINQPQRGERTAVWLAVSLLPEPGHEPGPGDS